MILLVPLVHGGQSTEFELTSGDTISADVYSADTQVLFLYLPSERGFGKGYVPTVQQLAFFGVDVWVLDLHSSYMVPKHRSSINRFKVEDVLEIVSIAKRKGFEKIFFLTSGRGAQLALKTAHQWQLKNPKSNLIKGHIFHSPYLIHGKPELGAKAEYVDISTVSNLPIYLLLPQFGTKYFRADEIFEQLKIGGSSIFTHRLKGAHGGFHMRNEKDLKPMDLKVKKGLSDTYVLAMNLMNTVDIPKVMALKKQTKNAQSLSFGEPILKPYKGKSNISLKLKSIDGQILNIKDFDNQVILINFWASWCKPCVTEIPSLVRLQTILKDKPFKILTVNVGESKQEIDAFMKKVKFDLPIMLDHSGQAVRDWGVYAYPSNFLLDKNGNIRYTYRGALEWDARPIVKTIQSLF
ncbi:MAG: thioredoxin family protein [Candidatus Ruthia sp. Apha_13_S6]|nr:thioredoxin family protein [Candidatus Ruthia sp. Apha_13_S6]